jgi:hypothetical protein
LGNYRKNLNVRYTDELFNVIQSAWLTGGQNSTFQALQEGSGTLFLECGLKVISGEEIRRWALPL